MTCNGKCIYKSNIKSYGIDDVTGIKFPGNTPSLLNWSEISVPEVLTIPLQKPDIEELNQVYVNANVDCAKLIETPYVSKIYERLATDFEITLVTSIVNAVEALNLAPIIAAVDGILNVPGLPAIPLVAALGNALTGIEDTLGNVLDVVADITTYLAGACIIASVLKTLLNALAEVVTLLLTALNELLAIANNLVAATAAIPVVGPAVAAAVATLVAAITVVLDAVIAIITDITDALLLIGATQYLAMGENVEGSRLSGRKLVIEGRLIQKVVYTALVDVQSVHSASFEMPFSAFIIVYPKFENITPMENAVVVTDPANCTTEVMSAYPYDPDTPLVVDLCETFDVDVFIEDIYITALNERDIFKNTTLFLMATPQESCQ